MGIFGNSSPFDQDVERATCENNTNEEWGLILEICDRAGASAGASRDCLRAILRRLAHPDPHVQVHAATLLDACVANCGKLFHLENTTPEMNCEATDVDLWLTSGTMVASREFETEFRRLVSRAQPAVASRLRALLRKWSEGEFRSDPQLDLIPALYKQLRAEAGESPASQASASPGGGSSTAAAAAAAQREQEELARAIALSLRETTPATTGSTASTLYPRVEEASATAAPAAANAAAPAAAAPARKVRALYDFEAAEDNELTFMAGEFVHVTDSNDPNWWKGYNERGEGLFPANFVTSDLSEPQPKVELRGGKSVQFAESNVVVDEPPAEIDEGVMDAALAMLHECDVEARGDEAALSGLESRVVRMGPLVDAALERADTRHARLTQLSAELVRALNLYHELMRAPPPPPPASALAPQYMYPQHPGHIAHATHPSQPPQPPRC